MINTFLFLKGWRVLGCPILLGSWLSGEGFKLSLGLSTVGSLPIYLPPQPIQPQTRTAQPAPCAPNPKTGVPRGPPPTPPSPPTGRIGVAAVTAGPGVTNAVTAIKNAQMAESPLLLIGGAAASLQKVWWACRGGI